MPAVSDSGPDAGRGSDARSSDLFTDGARRTRCLHLVVVGAAKGSEATLEGQPLPGPRCLGVGTLRRKDVSILWQEPACHVCWWPVCHATEQHDPVRRQLSLWSWGSWGGLLVAFALE